MTSDLKHLLNVAAEPVAERDFVATAWHGARQRRRRNLVTALGAAAAAAAVVAAVIIVPGGDGAAGGYPPRPRRIGRRPASGRPLRST